MLSSVYFLSLNVTLCEKRNSYSKIILFIFVIMSVFSFGRTQEKGECFVQSCLRKTFLLLYVPQNKAHSILYIYIVRPPFYFSFLFSNSCFTHLRELGKENMYIQYSEFFCFLCKLSSCIMQLFFLLFVQLI